MTVYGYRAALFRLTPRRKPEEHIPLNHVDFGPGGYREHLASILRSLLNQSHDDRDKERLTSVDRVSTNGTVFDIRVSTGAYGFERQVKNREGVRQRTIRRDEAVLDDAWAVFVVPAHGTVGAIFYEVRGRTHIADALIGRLRAADPLNLMIRLEREVADDQAWSAFLDDEATHISRIELTQRAGRKDGTALVSGGNAGAVTLTVKIENSKAIKRGILRNLNLDRRSSEPLNLTSLIGLTGGFDDDDFDQKRVVVVSDGKERTINVTKSYWPQFTYVFDSDVRPDRDTYRPVVIDLAQDFFAAQDVDLPRGWQHTELDDWEVETNEDPNPIPSETDPQVPPAGN